MKAVTWWKPLQSVIRTRHTGSHSAGTSITSMPSSLWMPAGLTTLSTLQKSSESSAVKRKRKARPSSITIRPAGSSVTPSPCRKKKLNGFWKRPPTGPSASRCRKTASSRWMTSYAVTWKSTHPHSMTRCFGNARTCFQPTTWPISWTTISWKSPR